jgi:hypothetical protein
MLFQNEFPPSREVTSTSLDGGMFEGLGKHLKIHIKKDQS